MFPSLLRQGEMFQENLIVQTWVYGVFVSLEWVDFFFVLVLVGYLFQSRFVYFPIRVRASRRHRAKS